MGTHTMRSISELWLLLALCMACNVFAESDKAYQVW
jgi:hypothetical protein